jgi:hypothetical protein
MKSSIDYAYYRISKLYYKYDSGTGTYAMLIISLTEGLFLLETMIFLSRFLFSTKQLEDSKFIGPVIVVVSMLPFFIINYIKYVGAKGKYDAFDNHWKNESGSNKTLKGFLIFISLLVPWLLLFPLNAYIQHVL